MDKSKIDKKGRLIIVSNRMPMTVGIEDGKMTLGPSAGGLVSALGAFLDRRKNEDVELSEYLWVGWPGNSIAAEYQPQVRRQLLMSTVMIRFFWKKT
jgi:trehalose 6-phosphate synthase/phosphatase